VIKINYFDEKELLVRKEIETKSPKSPNSKSTKCYPTLNARWSKCSVWKYFWNIKFDFHTSKKYSIKETINFIEISWKKTHFGADVENNLKY